MAALASVFFVGRRRVTDAGMHSIPLVALGTGLLWFGWYGFNAGSELQVDAVTGQAFLNTDIAASFAGPVWLLLAWRLEKERKPKFTGFLTGAVAGLATITPCAGFVTATTAAIVGTVAGVVCYLAVSVKNRLKWDDALDVWGVHGVGGILGTVMLGVFASKTVNPAGADGLLAGGGGAFLLKQTVAVLAASAWAFVFTYGMLFVIDKITKVVVTEAEESALDASLHGEDAYALGGGAE
jgi:ammonium transporter, Amt family